MRRLLTAVLGAAFVATPGCSSGPECNVLSCYDGLEIHARSNELLAPGRYRIEAQFDEIQGNCDIVFPRTTEVAACDPILPMTVHWQSSGFILSVLKRAEHIHVRIHRDDVLLGEGTYAPVYQTVETDGSVCSPTCEIARPEVLRLGS
jgi:hypothetical protein